MGEERFPATGKIARRKTKFPITKLEIKRWKKIVWWNFEGLKIPRGFSQEQRKKFQGILRKNMKALERKKWEKMFLLVQTKSWKIFLTNWKPHFVAWSFDLS